MRPLADVTIAASRRLCLIAVVVMSMVMSCYVAWRYLNGVVPAEHLFRLYEFLAAILAISWLVTDPDLPAIERPSFDHGFLIWVTFPFLAAYHMYRAHRWRGLLMVPGLLLLLFAPRITLNLLVSVR
jgi:hypothetical protein